jgi:hypothetical protein
MIPFIIILLISLRNAASRFMITMNIPGDRVMTFIYNNYLTINNLE